MPYLPIGGLCYLLFFVCFCFVMKKKIIILFEYTDTLLLLESYPVQEVVLKQFILLENAS